LSIVISGPRFLHERQLKGMKELEGKGMEGNGREE